MLVNRITALYDRYILDRPRLALAVLLTVFAFFAWHARDFKLDASTDTLILESDKDLRILRQVNKRYETQEFLVVTFTPHADLFSDASIETIHALREDLEQIPGVDSVFTLIDAPLVKIVGGKLAEVATNYRTLEDPDVDRDRAREELLASPIFLDLLISQDAGTTALQVNLKNKVILTDAQRRRNELLIKQDDEGLTEAEQLELVDTLEQYETVKEEATRLNHETVAATRAVMDRYRDRGTLYLGGIPMIADDMITFIKNDLLVFGAGVFALLVIMLSIIFRQARFVLLPLCSCIFAVVIMMGLLGLTGWPVTVISSNFISLMLILTMSMNVHLVVRYRQLSRDFAGQGQAQLVSNTVRRMVWPCLYTALTTMIGFGSLVVSDIKPVIDFGWMMTLGLSVTFMTSFLLFPTILVSLDKKITSPGREEVPFTAGLAQITERFGNGVVVIALLLAALSLYGVSRLKVENSFVNYFSDSTEIHQGLKLIDDELGGTAPMDVVLKFDPVKEYGEEEEETLEEDDEFADLDDLFGGFDTEPADPADAWFTAYKIDRIKAVHDYLDNLPAVGKVQSLASVLRLAEDLNQGEEFDAFELAIINKKLPPEIKEQLIDPYISIEDNEARINMRILDSLPDLRRKQFLEKIDADLRNELGLTGDEFQVSGMMVLYNNMLQSLFTSQIETLGVVMLGIALMLLVLFRSFSLAVIGILPNILAAGIILGLMGIMDIPLDMMTITIAAITIGIAVDNSIHYIYRFREERPGKPDYISTLYYCHANIGRAVFYTAITIIIGFSILVMSNFIPTIYFGLLTALAMFIALLAALTLLPKLILIFRPFGK
ncbi:MAG: MMPL family transporter [Gammaproteobacteria bacterium]|nr:MMPL family transporter [Gammaproteobacteria bacterium]